MDSQYSRRRLISAAAAGTLLGFPIFSQAEDFPNKTKPIRMIVPIGAGSSVDGLARAYARNMGEILGANVVVDNRPGAEGVIGVQAVKSAPADGYTILFTSSSTQAVNPHLFKQLSYDPVADFIPVAGAGKTPMLLNMGPSTTFKSAKEFFEAAKANPGKYTFASVSATTRLAAEMVAKTAGIQIVIVPYRNFGEAMTNLVGGLVDGVLVDAAAAGPFYKQGVRPLATTGSKRPPTFPEVPPLQEQGLPGFELFPWLAIYAPARTPAPIIKILADAASKSARSTLLNDFFLQFSMEPLLLTGEELAAYQRSELDKWGKLVRDSGLAGSL